MQEEMNQKGSSDEKKEEIAESQEEISKSQEVEKSSDVQSSDVQSSDVQSSDEKSEETEKKLTKEEDNKDEPAPRIRKERRIVKPDDSTDAIKRTDRVSDRRRPMQQRTDKGYPMRQGIRREEYRGRSYDSLPARDFNIAEIIESGNIDLMVRTTEDYAKTWSDRPPWIKNKFSTFQIRPIFSKISRIKKGAWIKEKSEELKMLKPLVAFIARRYHDDDLYEFARILRFSIDKVGDDEKKFNNMCAFLDSLLLYFRANGGK